jgi:hypothetical protein
MAVLGEYRTILVAIIEGKGLFTVYDQMNRNAGQRDAGHLFSSVGHTHVPDKEYDCSNRTVRRW